MFGLAGITAGQTHVASRDRKGAEGRRRRPRFRFGNAGPAVPALRPLTVAARITRTCESPGGNRSVLSWPLRSRTPKVISLCQFSPGCARRRHTRPASAREPSGDLPSMTRTRCSAASRRAFSLRSCSCRKRIRRRNTPLRCRSPGHDRHPCLPCVVCTGHY